MIDTSIAVGSNSPVDRHHMYGHHTGGSQKRDFFEQQMREIARLQALTLHQQWELERYGNTNGMGVSQQIALSSLTNAEHSGLPMVQYLQSLTTADAQANREKQLEKRRKSAEKLLRLRHELERQEKEVRSLERKAVRAWIRPTGKLTSNSEQESHSESTSKSATPLSSTAQSTPRKSKTPTKSQSPSNDKPLSSSVIDQVETAKNDSNTSIPTEIIQSEINGQKASGVSASAKTVTDENSDKSEKSTKSSRRYSWPANRRSSSTPHSLSVSISEASELEGRIQALKSELQDRRKIASKLKHEYRRRTNEHLQITEESLNKQLQAYNVFIDQTQSQLHHLERASESGKGISRPATPPRILSPRPSLTGSDTEIVKSPRKVRSPQKQLSSLSARSTSSSVSEVATLINDKDNILKETDSLTSSPEKKTETVTFVPSNIQVDDGPKTSDVVTEAETPQIEEEIVQTEVSPSKSVLSEKSTEIPADLSDKSVSSKSSSTVSANNEAGSDRPPSVPRLLEIGDLEPKINDNEQVFVSAKIAREDDNLSDKISGSLGIYEEDKRTENDVSSLEDEAETKDTLSSVEPSPRNDKIISPICSPKAEPSLSSSRLRLSDSLFQTLLNDAINDIVNIISQQRNTPEVGVIGRGQLDRVLQLAKNVTQQRSPRTKSDNDSPRSPRSPLSDRYMAVSPRRSPRDSPPLARLSFDIESTSPEPQEDQWMDDDFGLKSPPIVPPTTSPRSPKKHSPRQKLDFDKFTTDVFSVVPSTNKEIENMVNICASTLWMCRRYGEPIEKATAPVELFSLKEEKPDLDLSFNKETDKTYRQMIFDWSLEVCQEIFSEELELKSLSKQNLWQKATKLRLSRFARRPVRSAEDLAEILKSELLRRLEFEETKDIKSMSRANLISRKRLENYEELLLEEMYCEEPEWVDYEKEENEVKMEMTEQIWNDLLNDALSNIK